MPPRNLSNMLLAHMSTVFNIGIVILTFFESYMFPLAILKWMIVITKYGGVPSLLEKCSNYNNLSQPKCLRTRHQYCLQLITSSGNCKITGGIVQKSISNVSVVVDSNTPDGNKSMQVCTRR